ncbi:TolC family protein [Ferruginibacter paludis]|uniref:TolC family protein n=1 Tax=Ferruginibacter paludis TaxID=1310417 RepID=UPI0025B36B98|nr:TolC family protein [Ferruginibacter paludis]MDN3657186.1 TolC family protein [Ferruginibacter paludis]
MNHKSQWLTSLLVMLLFSSLRLHAQDTLRITLPEAEKQFLQKNLDLLAEKYNIDIARAQVIQARLYSNPNFSFNGNIYNPQNKKIADVSNKTGEYIIGLQQLIRVAGKRNKEIKLAETSTRLSENRFFDLLRTLRFSLRSNFYNAYYLQNSISAYNDQIASLESLSASYEALKTKGVVTLKDAIRIKSLLYSLKAEQNGLQNQLNDIEAELKILLQDNKTWFVSTVEKNDALAVSFKQMKLPDLVDTAYENRFDLKLAENNLLYNQQNLALQKAMAKPDITLGAQFDKRGSFVDNASFFNVAIDLPFFNRNQGNIKAAKINIDQSKVVLNQQRLTVENEVQSAYTKALNTDKMLQSIDPAFRDEFENLLKAVSQNFQKKNISLIDFTDFNESYKNNILQINELQNQKMQAIETLNFIIGKTILNN